MKKHPKIIISGGGTGGHIFPALSIADALRARCPEAEIRFVGAENRMEMERVPEAGYPIVGLPVAGFDRKNWLKNVSVLRKLCRSLWKARRIVREFRPDLAIGVGGYAGGPVLWAAAQRHIPILIQEQNSYAGVTNRLLARKATTICVAYEGMERFFPPAKIVCTGNPIRTSLTRVADPDAAAARRKAACETFGLDPERKTILILGGSLGARTINRSVWSHPDVLARTDVQFLWQTGKGYYDEARYRSAFLPDRLRPVAFISRMEQAYAAADLVISRAGAGSIAELCELGKPAVLVPSPNVAEDHQTKNALALVQRQAAVLIRDAEAVERLIPEALQIVKNPAQLQTLSDNIRRLARPDAANRIVDEIEKILHR
jgi:UDP-N-acetylglucosamine--N-acetylmuramyl-(pentapeptide) pyrophosphoryl-undecaprenol N-acetylglucosamine transferase